MRIEGVSLTTKLIAWLDQKKFKYSMDMQKSDPLHGFYYFNFTHKQEEMMTRLAWGLV